MLLSSAGCQRSPGSSATDTEARPSDPTIAAALSPDAERGAIFGAIVDPPTLSAPELQFGRFPKLDSNVVYQPDVLRMENGAAAIRSMESNGIVWHFDPSAPQVADIAVGKILFATERSVGRVLAVTPNGNDIAVVLEPVEIADVIQQAHVVFDQPLDVASAVVVPVPDCPMELTQADPNASASPGTNASASPDANASASPDANAGGRSSKYAIRIA